MAWERRRNGRLYYFRVRRAGTRVIKEYCGAGERGKEAAAADQAARNSRAEAKQARIEKWRAVDDIATQLDQLGKAVDQLTVCNLLSNNWKRHRREWRPPNKHA